MKLKLTAVSFFLLVGCSSHSEMRKLGPNSYVISGEADINYTRMVNDMYEESENTCLKQGKNLVVIGTDTGEASVGFASKKSSYIIRFKCRD
jgi:hypothetical protein